MKLEIITQMMSSMFHFENSKKTKKKLSCSLRIGGLKRFKVKLPLKMCRESPEYSSEV